MSIIGIVAVDRNGAIGKGGKLPWRYSADLRFFKEQTTGHACVMGRNTWLSLPKPLPNRLNIVLSRNSEIKPQAGVIHLRDAQSVLSLASYLAGDLFIIGGARVYETFLAHIDRWIVTEVSLLVEDPDTFMPDKYLEGFVPTVNEPLTTHLVAQFYERAS